MHVLGTCMKNKFDFFKDYLSTEDEETETLCTWLRVPVCYVCMPLLTVAYVHLILKYKSVLTSHKCRHMLLFLFVQHILKVCLELGEIMCVQLFLHFHKYMYVQ